MYQVFTQETDGSSAISMATHCTLRLISVWPTLRLYDKPTDRDVEAPFSIDEPRNPVA